MDILSIYGNVLFTSTLTVLKDVIVEAIKAKANLHGANLRSANLHGANLHGANLRSADLRSANLHGADLHGANLCSVDLYGANLYCANLCSADLRSANLHGANLHGANLRSADLYGANLYCANLHGADLHGANLCSVDLYGANLYCANLCSAKNAELVIAQLQFIPTEGSFVGWKKCRGGVIVKLGITPKAKRSHSTGRKCRCSRAKVLEVFGAEVGVSMHDGNFTYVKGQYVKSTNGWGENRWEDCAPGIHFFITREEAEAYS